MMRKARTYSSSVLPLALLLAACGERDARFDKGSGTADTRGLKGSVALFDEPLNRVLMLTSPAAGRLDVKPLPIGQNVATVATSADLSRLFVLSNGAGDPSDRDSEGPRLLVIDGGSAPKIERTFELDDPLRKLAVDPEGDWLVAYDADGVITNPNELVLFDLAHEDVDPIPRTIRSFGGSPEELIFTSELHVPEGGARRFLVVRTQKDITLIDLENVDRNEVTIKLPESTEGESLVPLQVVYSDGEEDDDTDARLAVRLKDTSDVVLIELGPSSGDKDFSPTVNIVDVEGIPSSIDFVHTDGGLRLAALVPSKLQATLVDPRTTVNETVDMPIGYSQMRRITDSVADAPENGDVALLFSPDAEGIAFWSLGQTSGSPFRSVDALNDLPIAVSSVSDVPGPHRNLKILSGAAFQGFYVLDLEKREASPLNAVRDGFQMNVSPDGGRFWSYLPGSEAFGATDLESLHTKNLVASFGVSALYDIERSDASRAAIALHGSDGYVSNDDVAVTLLDALDPDSAETSYFGGLLLEGL
jgi:dipeptidyl aminopeptidase/acylaminoacyl peptidase